MSSASPWTAPSPWGSEPASRSRPGRRRAAAASSAPMPDRRRPADSIHGMTPREAGLPRNIGAPATRALIAAGYTELGQLANVPASELQQLHGMGPKALARLQEALEEQGMSLG